MNDTSTLLPAAPQNGAVSLKSRFDALNSRRSGKMNVAWECAELTIPALLPRNQNRFVSLQNLPATYDSIGARAVNNLASKILLALFPPGTVWFRLAAHEVIVMQLANIDRQAADGSGDAGLKAKVDERLSMMEQMTLSHFERQALRAKLFELLKLLITTGDVLISKLPGKPMKVINLNNFVVVRDGDGNLSELVIREYLGYTTLTEELKKLVDPVVKYVLPPENPSNENLELYTTVRRTEGETFETWQELSGVEVPGSRGKYRGDKLPYLAIRWSEVIGEDYGRSMVEDYLGDLRALENDAHTLDSLVRACGKIVPMVNPNSVTKVTDLNRAEDGQFIYGRRDDVSFLTVDKLNDISVLQSHCQELRQDIKAAFLMQSVVQRDGERVTAEEIRTVAAELEENLGGVYSVLSQDLQLPLVKLLYEEVKTEFRKYGIADVELGRDLKVEITTGLEALGRGNDATKLRQFIADLAATNNPQVLGYLNLPDFIKRIGAARGIDMNGLVKTADEVAAEQEAMQNQQMMQQAVGSASGALPDIIKGAIGQTGESQQ